MTDYSDIVTDDIRVLDANANGRTPYDTLVLDIDEDGKVSLWINTVYGSNDGIPFSVWHGRTRRYTLGRGRGVVALDWLRDQLSDGGSLATLIDRVIAGHSVEWDGSNMRGHLTDDASEAEDEIERWIEQNSIFADLWSVWDEDDWIADEARRTITAGTTDEQIDAYLVEVRAAAASECVVLTGDARDWLIEMRDEKRAEAAADEE